MLKKILPLLLLCLFLAACVRPNSGAEFPQEFDWRDSPEVGAVFQSHGLNGTFVLFDRENGIYTGYNPARAARRYIPASTFKLPNSLIGLATGVAQTPDDVLPYGGQPQPFKSWERDMSLREAIKVSNVPIYQELARRIGPQRMQNALVRLDYGNHEIGDKVDMFWLRGPLKISALEQIHFLVRLAEGTLPVDPAAQALVREIALLESKSAWKLYGKTGTAVICEPALNWWVGWVEAGGRLYVFALNIDRPAEADKVNAVGLGRECLAALGVIDQ